MRSINLDCSNDKQLSFKMVAKEEIFNESYTKKGCDLAREYAEQSKINFYDLSNDHFKRLIKLINNEINILLSDESYSMIPRLQVKQQVKYSNNKYGKGVYLFCQGSYFESREAISFNRDGFIGFCGELNGCNQTPFIKGFINWIDELKS